MPTTQTPAELRAAVKASLAAAGIRKGRTTGFEARGDMRTGPFQVPYACVSILGTGIELGLEAAQVLRDAGFDAEYSSFSLALYVKGAPLPTT